MAVLGLLEMKDSQQIFASHFDHSLDVLERVGLLFVTLKPKIEERYERTFELLKSAPTECSLSKIDLSEQEQNDVVQCLDEHPWGKTAAKRKIARALLKRVDAVLANQNSDAHLTGKFTLEHVLPQKPLGSSQWGSEWSDEEREMWVNRLGNLCLLNQAKNSAASNLNFDDKKRVYEETIFPLTKMITKNSRWTPETVEAHHNWILESIVKEFDLA